MVILEMPTGFSLLCFKGPRAAFFSFFALSLSNTNVEYEYTKALRIQLDIALRCPLSHCWIRSQR